MTSDMAFECLLVSRDEELFRTMNSVLHDLSISISPCVNASRVAEALRSGTADLVVVDCTLDGAREVLKDILVGRNKCKPTVLAISTQELPPAAAHVVLRTPVTRESARKALKSAYSRMILDYRRKARYAVMMPVVATFDCGRTAKVTIADVGDGGVGIICKDPVAVGDTFSFRLWLPGAVRQIFIAVRVLWVREHGRAGCEFLRMPPVDLMILHDWLKSRVCIKKPRIEVN